MRKDEIRTYSIKEIDAMKGIITPHEKDLEDIGNKHLEILKTLTKKDLEHIAQKIGGSISDLNLDEEWTFTKEYFPSVSIHILYQDYSDEDPGMGAEEEIQFLYSGEHLEYLSGEDLIHLAEMTVDYMVLIKKNENFGQVYSGTPSELLRKAIIERTEPFYKVGKKDYEEIAKFIGGRDMVSKGSSKFKFYYSPYPEFELIFWDADGKIDFNLSGTALKQLPIYDTQRLVIMCLNQCLRKIKFILGGNAPDICKLMFSGLYKKKHPKEFDI